jgi:Tfp pilus assembly protein PilF
MKEADEGVGCGCLDVAQGSAPQIMSSDNQFRENLFGENVAALFLLYARPVAAISRILDHGRLWFAIVAALGVSILVHLPQSGMPTPSYRGMYGPAVTREAPAAGDADHNADEDEDRENVPKTSVAVGIIALAALRWIELLPGSFIAPIGALAVVFLPLVVFVRAVSGFGSSSVLMRRDYLTMLMCMLFAWAAAYLPVALAIFFVTGIGPWIMAFYFAGGVYFTVLAGLGLRTMLGVNFAPAAGLAVVGSIGAILGLAIYEVAGPLRSYAMSPFLLYYAYILFASDMRSLGDGLKSRQHLRNQLEIATNNPRDADAHYQLGLIYQNRRQYTEAIARFQRAVEIDPGEADPHFQLGRIAREQKRIDEAIRYLTTAAALDDKLGQSDVWRELGAAYFQAGKLEEAAAALAKYTDRRPYDPEGLYWYGRTLAGLGRGGEAREMFERAIEAVKTMPRHRRAEVRTWGRASKSELRKVG